MITESWSKLQLDAWIAGVLDGDGIKNKPSVNRGYIAGMNDREALETIHLRIGGVIVTVKNKGDNTRKDGAGATYRKDFYLLRWGKQYNGTKDVIPQSISRHMLEPDARARFYSGSVRRRDLTAPLIPWFAGYFVAEGCVDVRLNRMIITAKDRGMLQYWLNRYGGHTTDKRNGMWEWYNHTDMTPYNE
jgi:hypothetical protein